MDKLKCHLCKLLFLLLFPALSSCGPDKEVIIKEKVAERVNDFVRRKRAECRESLLQSAEHIVDSLLLHDAQASLLDSLTRLRPGRPYQPAPVPPIDSLSVQPIFPNVRPASATGGG